jgi:hypothetical protein
MVYRLSNRIFSVKKIINLTAEIAEHAEVKTGQGSRPRGREKSSPFSKASLKEKTAQKRSENDLCALCFLSGHLFVFFRRRSRERKILIPRFLAIAKNRREPCGRRDNGFS